MFQSKEEKPITSLSLFIIEKQIELIIGTLKNVKLKNGTLLVETNRKKANRKSFKNYKIL